MRRKDREITDFKAIKEIIEKTGVLHLALFNDNYPYIVPLHFGADYIGESIVFYMHCAKEGYKLDLIRKNPFACVELETDVELVSGGNVACRYGSSYSSVIANGKVRIIDNPEEKIRGLKMLMKHQTGADFEISEQMAETVEVLEFVSDSYAAKARS